MRRVSNALLLAASALLAACQFFGSNTIEQTLVVENHVLSTEIAAVRQTATVEADRMLVTLEHAQTSAAQVVGQTADLQATLVARGTQVADIGLITPQAPLSSGAPLPPIADSGAPQVAPITIIPGDPLGTPVPTRSGLDALLMTPVPLAAQANVGTQTGPLTNIVMADAVGSDDCAVQPMTTFSPNTGEIYVVALARGIGPGDEVGSLWQRGAETVADYTWAPGFEIEEACIWFYIDQTEIEFTPGDWSVQMSLNGEPVGEPVRFTIGADAGPAPGDAMLENALSGGQPTALPGSGG